MTYREHPRNTPLASDSASGTSRHMAGNIHVRGARGHNLKNVDVVIPRDTLTLITGLSGSGKSYLAFYTIYTEGQRRTLQPLPGFCPPPGGGPAPLRRFPIRLRPPVPRTYGQTRRRQYRRLIPRDLH